MMSNAMPPSEVERRKLAGDTVAPRSGIIQNAGHMPGAGGMNGTTSSAPVPGASGLERLVQSVVPALHSRRARKTTGTAPSFDTTTRACR